jgi:hypothetical protein
MRIDEQLYLVLPLDRADGTTVYVHAAPLGREVFERYWLPLSKTFAAIYTEGLGVVAGPRIAALMLKKVGEEAGTWDGPMGLQRGLLGEIRRLANVVAPGANGQQGWQMIPLEDAIRDQLVDVEDIDEIMGVLVFFTCAWRLHRQAERRTIATGAANLWGARTLSSNLSVFASSLATSTETDSTGATPPVPS